MDRKERDQLLKDIRKLLDQARMAHDSNQNDKCDTLLYLIRVMASKIDEGTVLAKILDGEDD